MKTTYCLISSFLLLCTLSSCSIYSLKTISINDPLRFNETIYEVSIKNSYSIYCDSDSTYFYLSNAAITGITDDKQSVTLTINPTDSLTDNVGNSWNLNSIWLKDYKDYISDTNGVMSHEIKSKSITRAIISSPTGEPISYSFTSFPAHISKYSLALHYKERNISERGNINLDKLETVAVDKVNNGKAVLLAIGCAALALVVILAVSTDALGPKITLR